MPFAGLDGGGEPHPFKRGNTAMTTVAITDLEEPEVSTICWGAVIAGAVASAALTLLLVAFGAGLTWGATLLRWHEPAR